METRRMSDAKITDGIGLFESLTDKEREAAAKIMVKKEYKEGDVIFNEGDQGRAMYVVASGDVSVNASISADVSKNVLTLRGSGVFGEMALVTGETRSASAEAASDAVLYEMQRGAFESLVDSNAEIGSKLRAALLKVVSARLRATTDMYKRAEEWGLQISGVIELNFHQLITDSVDITISLNNGSSVQGQLVKVEQSPIGTELLVRSVGDKFSIVPYQAVSSIAFNSAN
jgi:CRP-like cAMP-binding protein